MYVVHKDVYTDHKILQYLLAKKELNLSQRRWLESLNDYDISVLSHPPKANLVADPFSSITVGSVSHVDEGTKDLVKDVHRLSNLVIRLEDSPNGCCVVHHKSESSLVVEVKSI